MRILVTKADTESSACPVGGLAKNDHRWVPIDGADGLFQITRQTGNVVVADRKLPRPDRLSMVRAMRFSGVRMTALFLTVIGGTIVRTIGLAREKAKVGMKNLAHNMRRPGHLGRLYPLPA